MDTKLYLIPTFLGESESNSVFPEYNLQIINTLDEFFVEDVKTARRNLRKMGFAKSFDDCIFHELNEHTKEDDHFELQKVLLKRKSIGLLSEAGVPCVADPGSMIVKWAHEFNLQVIPLVGPSSILLSLMASGFNGQNFAFLGYLPIEKPEKVKRLKELESNIIQRNQTQIFIETPYRNIKLIEDIVANVRGNLLLCVAADLTLETQYIKTMTVGEWKKNMPSINKRACVFLLYK